MSCQRAMLLAVERAYPQSLDAAQRLIRLQLAHVGVRVQVHIGRTDHRGAIARTEPRGRAELPHFRPHDARIEGQRDQGGIAPLPVARPVLVRSQLEERLRARIERVQLFATNRPSAVGNPCPLFEVDRIQGGTEPRPMSGGAAEVMQARGLERIVRQTDALTVVQVLHRRLVVETAAFEQQDLVPRADPFQRHADAGRAGAHDAQVGFEHAAVRKGSSVDMHGETSGGGAVREKGEEGALARLSYRDHPSLQHHRPSDREVLLDQTGDGWGPRSRCENGRVQRLHLILAGHERAVPQSDLTHRLRSDQGEEIRLRQRQQVDCGVGAGPTRPTDQARQRTGGTHTEEPAPVHAHVRNTSVLTYRNPESMMIVPTVAPAPSRFATCSAATMLAPLEVPAKMASSRARRRAIALASSEATMKISFTSSRLQSGGMNPIPMPSIWCELDGFPESTADSAGSTPATCNRGL